MFEWVLKAHLQVDTTQILKLKRIYLPDSKDGKLSSWQ